MSSSENWDYVTFANEDSNPEFVSKEQILFSNEEDCTKDSPDQIQLSDYDDRSVSPVLYDEDLSHEKLWTESSFVFTPSFKCSKHCSRKCAYGLACWTDGQKEEVRKQFLGLNKVEIKNVLLRQLFFQRNSGIPTNGYFYHGTLLCVNAFTHISGVSSYLILRVLRDLPKDGYFQYIHGNASRKKCSDAVIKFISWMKVFSLSYGQDGPVDVVTILPSFLNRADLYSIYKLEAPLPHVKKSTFYKLLKTKFGPRRDDKSLPWIRISKFSTHSKCDICSDLDLCMRKAKTQAEINHIKKVKAEHAKVYSRARICVNEYLQKCNNFPDEVLGFQVDGMDSFKSMIPKPLDKSKQLAGMFRLPCRITGCISTSGSLQGNRSIKFFLNHGNFNLESFFFIYN